ncbi:hypothetical protein EGW08_018043 [Elysia chlorotica]|uniref:Uncharacterized protein n=1 Tax=Elysia chlorotica TaxID=188477 RepID=A0A3S0ZGB7_ELYCH|nr:hypothetical protein EGW08_018043 [Elysia chlorotica]
MIIIIIIIVIVIVIVIITIILIIITIILIIITTTSNAGKLCIKRSELGDRAGNLYVCHDPRLSECCEREDSFLCCEPAWQKILLNQVWLVSTLLVIFLALTFLYACYNRQEALFESETARQAALRFKQRAQRAYASIWRRPDDNHQLLDEAETGHYHKLPKGNNPVQAADATGSSN